MAQLTLQPITDSAIWENFLATRPEASFLQSWYWGVFSEKLNKHIERVGFFDDQHLIGVMLTITEAAKRGKYLTVPGGPILDWQNQEVVELCMTEVRRQAKAQHCSFVRVRPQLEDNEFSQKLFSKLGFKTSPMHLGAEQTLQLDITQSEEELLAQMRKSTRYEVKKAEKVGVTFTASTDSAEIKTFYDLQLETAERQHFTPFRYEFLHEQFKAFAESNHAILFSAYFEKELLAQAFIIFYGEEAVYHYGASTEAGHKYPGAYLLQWEAIKEAKRRGMKRYNFWGVANDPKHRYYSISIFKRGFGGYEFSYLHAQDLVIDSLKYSINFLIENIRKRMRKL